jgi:hypothetical protein
MEDLDVDGRIITKMILKEVGWYGVDWRHWLRIGRNGGLL